MKSLFATEERERKLSKLGDPLESLNQYVNFSALATSIDRALLRPYRCFGGRPPYLIELMIRLLVIQQLFNLSDAQLEFQVLDRTSFQRFLGIRDSGKVPDCNTVWAFRERLVQAGLGASLFGEVNRQLQAGVTLHVVARSSTPLWCRCRLRAMDVPRTRRSIRMKRWRTGRRARILTSDGPRSTVSNKL